MADSPIALGNYQYYPEQQVLTDGTGQEVKLRPQSLNVLHYLASKPNQVISKDDIFKVVWPDVSVTDDSLVQCIGDIRRVIGDKKHEILLTVPRRGYKLVPSTELNADSQSEESTDPESIKGWQFFTKRPALAALFGIIAFALLSFIFWPHPANETAISTYKQAPATDSAGYSSTLLVKSSPDAAPEKSKQLAAFQQELQVALGRYGSVLLTNNANADYQLLLDEHALGKATTQQITLRLKHPQNASTIFTESYELADAENAVNKLAIRAAAAIASPGVGAIGRHLLKSSQLKSADELTPAECYAYGYGCTKCSGEEDVVDFKAKACIANLLDKNPNDAKAWALQATLYSHQYLFGTTLKEPERSSLPLRKSLPQKAIDAATKAESLSTGNDSAIYWGLSQAYYTSCQADKMKAAIDRGLEINPDDPNLLAAFGNWLQYSGRWDEGSILTKRALEIEPDKHKKWWLMGPAKAHFAKEEYE